MVMLNMEQLDRLRASDAAVYKEYRDAMNGLSADQLNALVHSHNQQSF